MIKTQAEKILERKNERKKTGMSNYDTYASGYEKIRSARQKKEPFCYLGNSKSPRRISCLPLQPRIWLLWVGSRGLPSFPHRRCFCFLAPYAYWVIEKWGKSLTIKIPFKRGWNTPLSSYKMCGCAVVSEHVIRGSKVLLKNSFVFVDFVKWNLYFYLGLFYSRLWGTPY